MLYKFAQEQGNEKLAQVCLGRAKQESRPTSRHRRRMLNNRGDEENQNQNGPNRTSRHALQSHQLTESSQPVYQSTASIQLSDMMAGGGGSSVRSQTLARRPPIPTPRKTATPSPQSSCHEPLNKPPPIVRSLKPSSARRLAQSCNHPVVIYDSILPSCPPSILPLKTQPMKQVPSTSHTFSHPHQRPIRNNGVPAAPALPPRKTDITSTPYYPPPLPPKTFLHNNNKPNTLARDKRNDDKVYVDNSPAFTYDHAQSYPEKLPLKNSVSSTSSCSSQVSPTSSNASSPSYHNEQLNDSETSDHRRIECIHFGVV
jgi:hypothetical protein